MANPTEVFDGEVSRAMRAGWTLAHRDDRALRAQLTKRKSRSLLLGLILFCIMILPGVLYLTVYQPGQATLVIEVDDNGKVRRTEA